MTRSPSLLLLVILLCQASRAQTIETQELMLSNGLKVVMVEDHTVPSVCVAIAFRVGSRNERPGITGISHLFEHMMFNGSRRYKPMEFDRILEAGGGYSNAYTSTDITFYYEEFNPDLLDRVLDMEADRMQYLKIDTANLEQERGIVKEERRVSTDNNVQSTMFEELYAAAFVAHPYQHPVVGWMGDLENITVQDARDYFRMYYAPNNATVIVVGDFNPKTLGPAMEKLFAHLPAQPMPRPVNNAEPEQRGERRITLHKVAELPAVAIGYKGVGVSSPDFYPLQLLASILSHGQSSRLYRRLVYELQVATEVGAGMDEFIDPGLFTFYVQMQRGRRVNEAETEVYNIIRDISRNGVTERELQKAKNAAQVAYVNELKTHHGIANTLGYHEVVHGSYRKALTVLEMYDRVSVNDIQRVAAEYLTERARTVVVLVPERSRTEVGDASTH